MTYLLDANVFIQAKNAHYAFDVVPAFWDWLKKANADGKLYTAEKVADEIFHGGDDLAAWMRALPTSFRINVRPEDQTSLQTVATWATTGGRYTQAAQSDFLRGADYFLVAQAHSLGYTVVTHEIPAPAATKRIKIPDACQAVGVPWMSPFRMLSVEQVRFQLQV